MNKCFCRIYQGVMRVAMYFLPWRKPIMILGENAISRIPELYISKDIGSVIIITDTGITSRGLHNSLIAALDKYKMTYILYDKTVPNPTIDNIEEAYKLYSNNSCQGIIAIGGGSALDCAKGVGARVANPNKTITNMRGLLKVRHDMPLFVAIPTTAGTGSETTLAAVITDSNTHEKYALNDPHLIPHYAFLDPSLTLSLPPSLTASTGMDALTHAVEAYIGHANTKGTKKASAEATKLIFKNLPIAFKEGTNIEARENMQKAAYLAGIAFTRAYVGNVHAIAHTLGGQYGTPHGLANAIILPVVLDYYGKSIYKSIGKLCDKAELFDSTLSNKEKTKKFIAQIKDMNQSFGFGFNIDKLKLEDIPMLIPRAMREANPLYPVPKIFSYKDFDNIYTLLCD